MPDDTPSIAILGAGPTGLEAALAAAEHDYAFTLYEAADTVAGNVLGWGHVELFSPWAYDVSPRARRALTAAGITLPALDDPECPTGKTLVERVLRPLSELEEIHPNVRTGVRVISVGREGLLKHEEISSDERRSRPFRLLLRDHLGHEWTETADIVLDCTGSYSKPNALGDGGISAPGELLLEGEIEREIPDFDVEAEDWIDRTVLLVGAGHSALTAVTALADLAARAPETSVIWALRREHPSWPMDPEDPLPGRSRLAEQGLAILGGASPAIHAMTGVVVESLSRDGEHLAVGLRHTNGTVDTVLVDKILSLTGSVGDHEIYRQLQVHECYATLGPMKLAAALLGSSSADCLDQEGQGVETLLNPEPDFFILGSKSYGRNASFLMRLGWQQVDEVFELLLETKRAPRAVAAPN